MTGIPIFFLVFFFRSRTKSFRRTHYYYYAYARRCANDPIGSSTYERNYSVDPTRTGENQRIRNETITKSLENNICRRTDRKPFSDFLSLTYESTNWKCNVLYTVYVDWNNYKVIGARSLVELCYTIEITNENNFYVNEAKII